MEDFHVAASRILLIDRFLAKLAEVETALREWALTGAEGPRPPEGSDSKITSLKKKLIAPFERALFGFLGDLKRFLGAGNNLLVVLK